MAKTHLIFEDLRDHYPLAITHADALLLLHEEMIQDPYEYVESRARGPVYSGLVLEGMPSDSYLALVPMEMIEYRLQSWCHVEKDIAQP